MLARTHRLSTDTFNTVMEKGRVSHSSLFLVRALKGQADTRIAAVAPKKAAKTAAARNYMRRKIYEAIRTFYTNIIPGVHVIIFANTSATKVKLNEISADLKQIFVKGGLLR